MKDFRLGGILEVGLSRGVGGWPPSGVQAMLLPTLRSRSGHRGRMERPEGARTKAEGQAQVERKRS